MTRKILIYIKSGGFSEVYSYALIFIKKIFYYKSETIFYLLKRDQYNGNVKNKNITFIEFKNADDLEKIKFERIREVNYKEWLKKESVAIIGLYDDSPISFTWTHFRNHKIKGVAEIELLNNQCWVGPSFVIKEMRGKEINRKQHHYRIKNTPAHIQYFLTSVNSKNYASLRSLEKIGFKAGLKVVKYYGFLTNEKTEINYLIKDKSLFQLRL